MFSAADRAAVTIIAVAVVLVPFFSFLHFSTLAAGNSQAPVYPVIIGDSLHYSELADAILQHHTFGDAPSFAPSRYWPPGYAAFLTVSRGLTGGFTLAAVLQVLLTVLSCILIYRMARTWVESGWALASALLYGLDPSVVFASTTILSDALFSSLVLMVVYLCFFAQWPKLFIRFGIAGLLLGAAMLVRPIGEFLILVIPAAYVVVVWLQQRQEWKRAALASLFFVLACAVVVVPWVVRNEHDFGVAELASVGGNNLFQYNAREFMLFEAMHTWNPLAALLAARTSSDPRLVAIDAEIKKELAARTPQGSDPQDYESAVATSIIMQHPVAYAYFHGINMIPFFLDSSIAAYQEDIRQVGASQGFDAPTSAALMQQVHAMKDALFARDVPAFAHASLAVAPIALEVLFWAIISLLALSALFVRTSHRPLLLVLALLVLYFAFLTGPVAIARYRIPAEPYLFVLAVVGAGAIMQKIYGRTR